jgi:hypothetical protein
MPRGAPHVADAQAAGAQRSSRFPRPFGEQLLGVPEQIEHRAGGRRVHHGRIALLPGQRRFLQLDGPKRLVPAQRQAHLCGQLDSAGVDPA